MTRSDTGGADPIAPPKSSFADDARKRRYREFAAQHWRPVPAPPPREKPSFWATSWDDAQNLFRGRAE